MDSISHELNLRIRHLTNMNKQNISARDHTLLYFAILCLKDAYLLREKSPSANWQLLLKAADDAVEKVNFYKL